MNNYLYNLATISADRTHPTNHGNYKISRMAIDEFEQKSTVDKLRLLEADGKYLFTEAKRPDTFWTGKKKNKLVYKTFDAYRLYDFWVIEHRDHNGRKIYTRETSPENKYKQAQKIKETLIWTIAIILYLAIPLFILAYWLITKDDISTILLQKAAALAKWLIIIFYGVSSPVMLIFLLFIRSYTYIKKSKRKNKYCH